MAQKNRAKYGYLTYADIFTRISEGILDEYDVVYTIDTNECYIIKPDLTPSPIRSKVYVFNSVAEAEEKLNQNTDTYDGQIVSILYKEYYCGYIVNSENGAFKVTPLFNIDDINYDTLGNKPIENLVGTLDEPIFLSSLSSGTYSIKGQYKVDSSELTTFLNASPSLFMIDNNDSDITIKKITSSEIIDYHISDGVVSSSTIITQEYLSEKGYITESNIDEKITAYNFIKKDEAKDYVKELVISILDEELDTRIDKRIEENIQPTSNDEIAVLFN